MIHRTRTRAVLAGIGSGTLLAAPVLVLAYLVRAESGPVIRLDQQVISAATELTRGSPLLRDVLVLWQEAFRAIWVNLAVTLVCIWVWRRRGLAGRALWAFATLMAAWALGLGAKLLVQRARPVLVEELTRAPGYSFPSGHATNTTVAGVVLLLLLWPLLGRRGRVVVPAAVGVAVAVTAADRVLLGVHFPSDVVAGVLFGVAMAVGSFVGYSRWRPPAPPGGGDPGRPGRPAEAGEAAAGGQAPGGERA